MGKYLPDMNVDWFSAWGNTAAMLTYILVALFVLGIALVIYYFYGFQIRARVYPLYGSGKDHLSIGKPKNNRFKWINKRTAWKSLFPIMNKKEIEPFEPEYIYAGNNVQCYKYGDEFIPIRHDIEVISGGLNAKISAVPHYIRNWQSLAHKKVNTEYAQMGFWEQNKYFFAVIITAGICAAIVIGTIWLTYKFAAPGTEAMNNLASSIRDFGVIPGK